MFIDKMFNEFQVKQIKAMNEVLVSMLIQNRFEEMRGAMAIANKIINLPYKISKEDDVKEKIAENLKFFQSNFIKEAHNVG